MSCGEVLAHTPPLTGTRRQESTAAWSASGCGKVRRSCDAPCSKGARGTRCSAIKIQVESVPRQIRDADHYEIVSLAKPDQVGHAGHRAILIDDLADHAGGIESGESRQIDRSFRLATPFQHTAGTSAKRKDMSGPRQIGWTGVGINGGSDRVRPIVRRDAG